MIEESIYQKKRKKVLNVNGPNSRTVKYVKQKLMKVKEEINISTIIARYTNIPFLIGRKLSRV